MAARPTVYNLFWAYIPHDEADVAVRVIRRPVLTHLPLGPASTVSSPSAIEAIVLYPAFLTPAIVSRDVQDFFEVLLLAPSAPEFNATLVNRYLKISTGFDPEKLATNKPLFAGVPGPREIEVRKITTPRDQTLETNELFRGIVDERFWDVKDHWETERAKHAKTKGRPKLDTLYAVRIAASCIPAAAGPSPEEIARVRKETGTWPEGTWPNLEPQDEMIQGLLTRLNGPDLRGNLGRGLHCFPVDDRRAVEKVDLSSVDPSQPIRAYHPVFVYEKLGYASVGHVSDLHLNARQSFLARSTARVVETDAEDAHDGATPPIGSIVNVYSDNTVSVLKALAEGQEAPPRPASAPIFVEDDEPAHDPADLLLVGGDLIDHVQNVYPYGRHTPDAIRGPLPAARVWDLVSLAGDAPCYQPFVDHLTFHSILLRFCAHHGRPAFVVSGNHDVYSAAYGISPRFFGPRNEGIPADHNLTFYEAILVFGESYGKVKWWKAMMDADLFAWFYGVFTPFRDYDVVLPHQRIVGLGWGDDEQKVFAADYDDHGLGHLPRANESVGAPQLALVQRALADRSRKILFATHFTFVSYKNEIPNLPGQSGGQPGRVGTGSYSRNDWGTFERARAEMYGAIHDAASAAGSHVQCVITGHSHRKGLYYLNGRGGRVLDRFQIEGETYTVDETSFATSMYSLHSQARLEEVLRVNASRTPIVVSDSAGPVPRMNLQDEFGEWGSDRAAGTFVRFSSTGVVDRVVPVAAPMARSKPRAVVSIDYLHVLEKRGITSIETDSFDGYHLIPMPHLLHVRFHERFPRTVTLRSGMLHCKPGRKKPWIRIPLTGPARTADGQATVVSMMTPQDAFGELWTFLTTNGTPRFLSLDFRPLDDLVARKYEFNLGGPWSFEVGCITKRRGATFKFTLEPKAEIPNFALRRSYLGTKYGSAS